MKKPTFCNLIDVEVGEKFTIDSLGDGTVFYLDEKGRPCYESGEKVPFNAYFHCLNKPSDITLLKRRWRREDISYIKSYMKIAGDHAPFLTRIERYEMDGNQYVELTDEERTLQMIAGCSEWSMPSLKVGDVANVQEILAAEVEA